MSYFYDFVSKYKAILSIKINNVEKTDYSDIIKEVAKATLMVIFISLIIGYLTKSLQNLNYVVYISNITLLGSFVLYKCIKEIKYKKLIKEEYNIWIAISVHVVMLIGVIALTNSMLYFFVYQDMVSIYDLYILISISFLVQVFLFIMEKTTSGIIFKSYGKIVIGTALWQFILMVGLMLIMNIESITLCYVLSIMILIILYLLTNYLFNREQSIISKEKRYVNDLVVVLLCFITVTFLLPTSENYKNISLFVTLPNIEKTYVLEDNLPKGDISSNSEYVFIVSLDTIYLFTHEFVLEKEIEFTADIAWSYVNEDIFYIIMIEDEDEKIPYENYEYNNSVLYKLSNDNELEYILESIWIKDTRLLEYEDGYIRVYYTQTISRHIPFINMDGDVSYIPVVSSQAFIVNDVRFIYFLEEQYDYIRGTYNNGYVIVVLNDAYHIINVEDYFASFLTSDRSDFQYLEDYDNYYIKDFYVTDDLIVAKVRNDVIKVYDLENLNKLGEYEFYKTDIYMDNNIMFYYEDNLVHVAEYNDLYRTVINTNNDIVIKNIVVLLIGLYLVVEPKSLLSKRKAKK